MAVDADLHDVTRELFVRGVELGELIGGLEAPAIGSAQGLAVDVLQEHQPRCTTHRAVGVERLAKMAGGPEQLGLGIANVEAVPFPGPQITQHRTAGECVVDDAAHGGSVGREERPESRELEPAP